MSARATWKGVLKVSLVNIPIKVYPATESSDGLTFNQLHQVCSTRITQRRWCVNCAREVPNAEIVKGFEFETGRYVVLADKELATVTPESTRVIDLVQFADGRALDPIAINRSYYLAPDGPRARDAYGVLRDAMKGQVGIGKVALYGREYLVAVRPMGNGLLVLHTLHHAAEIRSVDAIEDLAELRGAAPLVPRASLTLARELIAAFHGPLDLAAYQDDVRAGLQALIDAKIAGQEIVAPTVDRAPAIADLREALTLSLQAVTKSKAEKARMAKATMPTRKRA